MDIQIDPKIYHDFYFKIAMPMRPPLTTRKILEEFIDADVNSESVAKVIEHNQFAEYMMMQAIKGVGSKENTPSLQSAIVMMGMQGTREFHCALQLMRRIGKKAPKVDEKSGKLDFKAKDHVKFAIKTDDYVGARKLPFTDTAFAAGLMFDAMAMIGLELFEEPDGYAEFVAEIYKHGLKTAMIASFLVKSIKNFGFSKYVFPACLIHDIGKLAMFLLYPKSQPNSYFQFREDVAKKPTTREIIHFLERKRFGMTHEYYSAQMAYSFQLFRNVERAILFHHDPYTIKSTQKENYSLAALIALASNIANTFRVPVNIEDPIYQVWFTPELKDFKVDKAALMKVMQRLGSETF